MADTARHALLILLAVVAATTIIVAISVVVVLYHKRKKKKKNKELSDAGSCTSARWLPQYNSYAVGKSFTFEEIRKATSNFTEALVIGVGGFGKVFCGVVDDVTKNKVAIKQWNPSPEQSMHEAQTEIEALSKLRHPHLVSLVGFCLVKKEMILVCEYMEHGTLREHLYNNSGKPVLSWRHRLHVCIGAARGLHYLHTGGIIHRNVKTTTILIDKYWVAKVSDFGLPKSALTRVNQMLHLSTSHVNGSYGYTDPEYFCREQLTDKSDVYSFGIVLFEVLMARTALNPALPSDQVSLANYALACQRNGTLPDAVDPVSKDEITPECLNKFADTAVKCLADQGMERPTMEGVLSNLELAMQLLRPCLKPQ